MGLSIRAYARHRGVSHVAVLRAVKQGRVSLEPDGTVDPAKADASWERSSDPSRRKPAAEKLRPVAAVAVGPVRDTLREQGLPTGGNVSFVQARTAHEIAKAHRSAESRAESVRRRQDRSPRKACGKGRRPRLPNVAGRLEPRVPRCDRNRRVCRPYRTGLHELAGRSLRACTVSDACC